MVQTHDSAGGNGQSDWIAIAGDGGGLTLRMRGDWSVANAAGIDRDLHRLVPAAGETAIASAAIDVSGIGRFDTTGAWLIERTRRGLEAHAADVRIDGADEAQAILLERMRELSRDAPPGAPRYGAVSRALHRIGVINVDAAKEAADLLRFLGVVTVTAARTIVRPGRIRLTALVSHVETAGLNALPIVGLLSFIIGVVLAYQGADQLRRFGAEIFTVNLLGVAILREMAILMTAIIIAGRSGSAFTAQIGTMQVNEEVDAMRTIGLDPIEVLVLPRAAALTIAMPLLVVYSDFMGLLGGCIMALVALDISVIQFTERLRESVSVWAFWVGLIKAPVFGFAIALVGCREGLKVGGSAESVGRHTTRSVVISIFLVMVLDAVFSIFFSAVGV